MDIDSLAKSEFPSINNIHGLFQLFIAQLIKDFSSANFDSDFITHLKPDVQEIQFAIAAIHNVQIYGKDAHTVSNLLRKFEEKLATIQEVKQ